MEISNLAKKSPKGKGLFRDIKNISHNEPDDIQRNERTVQP